MYPPIAPLKIGLRGGYIPSLAFYPTAIVCFMSLIIIDTEQHLLCSHK